MKLKLTRHGAVLTLGREEKALWQRDTADGRDIADARRAVRERADDVLSTHPDIESVEVYAPASAGGFLIEQYERRG